MLDSQSLVQMDGDNSLNLYRTYKGSCSLVEMKGNNLSRSLER